MHSNQDRKSWADTTQTKGRSRLRELRGAAAQEKTGIAKFKKKSVRRKTKLKEKSNESRTVQ